MSKKLDIKSIMKAGIVNLYKTDSENVYVMVVCQKDKEAFVIPFVNDETTGPLAYIPDSYSIADYSVLASLITAVFDNDVYKGIARFTPIKGNAPEHTKNILSFVKAISGNKCKSADMALTKAGYSLPVMEVVSSSKKRDYSALMKIAEYKEVYDENHELLKQAGATYEDLPSEIKLAHESVVNGSSLGVIFEGPTGTGKSWAAKLCADHDKAPLLNLQITYGTTIEDLVGQFIPNNDPNSDAKWTFVEGPLLKAYHLGLQIVIEEINYGQPGVNAKLNEFTDGTMRVSVNGKYYKKHPNFVCYMTMNPGYEGTECLNVALKNRFAKVSVPALTTEEFIARGQLYSRQLGHELSHEFFDKLFSFAAMVEHEAGTSKWHENVKFSIRNAQRLCDCILQKKCSFNDFVDAISVQYLNDLSTDNDNSIALEDFKKNKDIKAQIKEIYECYDFSEMEEVDVTSTLEECSEAEAVKSEKEVTKDALVDDLFEGLE